MAGHQRLGEGLGALDGGRARARPEHREAPGPQRIGDAGHQRLLRPDDDEVHVVRDREPRQPLDVVHGEVEAARVARDAGVAGRRPDLLDERALGDLPGERVLAAAAADQQDPHSFVHSLPSPEGSRTSRCARAMRAHGLPASSSR